MKIEKEETEIIGHWLLDGKSVKGDENCGRIEWLRDNYLMQIAVDESGWLKLYQDPEDGRYWQLQFPKGEMQGAGPHTLILMSREEAKAKYKI